MPITGLGAIRTRKPGGSASLIFCGRGVQEEPERNTDIEGGGEGVRFLVLDPNYPKDNRVIPPIIKAMETALVVSVLLSIVSSSNRNGGTLRILP